jgi:hypothetical protein
LKKFKRCSWQKTANAKEGFRKDEAAGVAGAEEKNVHVLIWVVVRSQKKSLQTSTILAI